MAKKLAIIGAATGQYPICLKARQLGYETHCFAWANSAVCRSIASEFHDISIMDTDVIVEICRKIGVQGVVSNASETTAAVAANIAEKLGLNTTPYKSIINIQNKEVPIPADSPRKAPLDGDHAMYVIAKNAAVDTIEHYHTVFGIKRFILRLSRVYAYHPNPYTYTDGKKVMVSDRQLIEWAEQGRPIEIWGEADRVLETCSMVDFLQIVQRCAECNGDGGLYNIGSGGSTLDERIRGIVEIFSPHDNKSPISYAPDKPSPRQFLLDITKTINELGYTPSQKWIDYCRWFKEEREAQRFVKLWGTESDY